MKNRLTLFMLITLSLFLLNSCELLNPIIGNSTNKIAPNPSPHNFSIAIETTEFALQGQHASVEITLDNKTLDKIELGGFTLMVTYDASALTFQSATPGEFIDYCGWRYFTYHHEIISFDSQTNYQAVRITSLANVGHIQPICYSPNDTISNQLAVLDFIVTNDRAYECSNTPIQFFWEDCGDNALSDITGNQLFVSEHIYNKTDENHVDYSEDYAKETPFPSLAGYNNSCDTLLPDSTIKPYPIRNIDFINGGIDIVCADSINTRCNGGDLNNNGISFELVDAILYSNYFVYGMQVFTNDADCQIEASETNGDGLTLTVADFVYLVRVLVGDASRYLPIQPINAIVTEDNGILSVDKEMGAVLVVVEGDVIPELRADQMTMGYVFDGVNTRILIYSLEGYTFSGEFIYVDAEIVSVEFGSVNGATVIL